MLHTVHGPHWHTRLYLAEDLKLPDGSYPELYLTRMGRFESDGHFSHQQVPLSLSVHVITQGRGRMVADGHSYEVGPNDIFVFFPNQHIRYADQRNAPWRYTWFTLRGTLAEKLLAQCGFTRETPLRTNGRTPALEQAFQAAETLLGGPRVSALTASSLCWNFIRELEPSIGEQPRANLATQAQMLFDHYYGSRLSINEIAAKLGISRSTLFRVFQLEYGRSPKQVLDDLRLQKAKHLLKASTDSIKEIATACGFNGLAYFSRLFKAQTGIPPSQWRKESKHGY